MAPGTVAVAAPHPAAVAAARRAVSAGGNAVDAALAAAAVLTVVYPHQCALGGDLVALVREPDGTTAAILGVGASAIRTDPAGGVAAQGARSVTVPGVVSGWVALASGSRLGLAPALLAAAELAEDGATISPGLARAVAERSAAVAADPGLRALLTDGDGPRRVGAPLPQPALAATLRTLAADPDAFYRGPVADAVVAFLAGQGGALRADDLAAHTAEVTRPLEAQLGDTRWQVAPPPSQGVVLLAVLRGLARTGAGADPMGLLDVVQRACDARDALLADPRGGRIDVDALLAARTHGAPLPASRAAGDTVAVTAVDDTGRAVSLVQSVYQSFGAGLLDPATGIVLHNRGSAFAADPGHPAALAPGRRPPHTLCPVLGERGATLLAAGCQGGRAQAQILAQVLPALLTATDPVPVLDRPRWVVGGRDVGQPVATLVAEPGAWPADRAPGLPVHRTRGRTDLAGHVQVARSTPAGLDAASDPRADGVAAVLL
jgi:gamma-glutamyltranspeptidase